MAHPVLVLWSAVSFLPFREQKETELSFKRDVIGGNTSPRMVCIKHVTLPVGNILPKPLTSRKVTIDDQKNSKLH